MADNQADMKAVTCARYGGPEVLAIKHMPRPVPGPGEIEVAVRVSTVNRTDTATLRAHPWFARGMTGWLRPRHCVTGMDFAGIVERVGAGVTGFAVGDRVFGMSPDRFGAHAEYLVIGAEGPVAQVPEQVALEDAVICEGFWYAHMTTRQLEAGQALLIYGASGAIGTAALQLAKAQGAEVTAVVGTQHVDLAQDLGADRVVNYQTEDFTALGPRFDMVFDAVGHTSFFACRGLLKPGGVYRATDLGPGWSNLWLAIWPGGRVSVPFPEDAAEVVHHLAGLMRDGRIRGVFDQSFAMDEVQEAFTYVETGRKTGIVRLDI